MIFCNNQTGAVKYAARPVFLFPVFFIRNIRYGICCSCHLWSDVCTVAAQKVAGNSCHAVPVSVRTDSCFTIPWISCSCCRVNEQCASRCRIISSQFRIKMTVPADINTCFSPFCINDIWFIPTY